MIGAYLRVSTVSQAEEGYSLETQEELCIKRALSLGYHKNEVKIYREGGRSGEDIDRPMMNQLRDDTASGLIEKIIITDPDRLTRDLTDKLIVCKEWDRQGVEIIFIDTEYQNTPEGQMFFNMRSVFAQYELAQIRKRTTRGRLRAVEKDKKIMPMRSTPYGYDYKDGKLVINEQEAKFVPKIYEWYLNGKSMREIGEMLYKEGAVPKRKESNHFGASSIQRILTSEIYIGNYVYNKRKTKKKYGEKTKSGNTKKTYSIREEKDWIRVDVPALIDKKTHQRAQKQREKNTIKGGNIKYKYLLQKKLRCKHCGRLWECTSYNGRVDKETGQKRKYLTYRCPNLNPKRYGDGAYKCKSRSLKVEEMDRYILDLIQQILLDEESLTEMIVNEHNTTDSRLDDDLKDVEEKIERKTQERERIKRMYIVAEAISEEEMTKEMKKLNRDLNELKEKREELILLKNKETDTVLTKEDIEEIKDYIYGLFDKDEWTFEEKKTIVDALIDEIEIDAHGSPISITIKGPLNVIASCTECQKV
jgi:site-specific DNA recombinase